MVDTLVRWLNLIFTDTNTCNAWRLQYHLHVFFFISVHTRKCQQPPINRSLATYSYRTSSPYTTVLNQSRTWPYYLSSVQEAINSSSTLSKWAVQPQSALHFVDSTLNLPRCQSTVVQGGLDLARQQHQDQQQRQRFALKGEDLDDMDESEPLDDRDSLSHHTHHKEETVPLDDRDFDSVHTRHEEDPSVPLDDRDFDSHYAVHHNAAGGRGGFDGQEKEEE